MNVLMYAELVESKDSHKESILALAMMIFPTPLQESDILPLVKP